MTRLFITLYFKSVDEILWCYHSLHCAIESTDFSFVASLTFLLWFMAGKRVTVFSLCNNYSKATVLFYFY